MINVIDVRAHEELVILAAFGGRLYQSIHARRLPEGRRKEDHRRGISRIGIVVTAC